MLLNSAYIIFFSSSAHFSVIPGDGTSLKPVKLHAGSGSQIDLSVPANKAQRQQAMVRECIAVSHFNF